MNCLIRKLFSLTPQRKSIVYLCIVTLHILWLQGYFSLIVEAFHDSTMTGPVQGKFVFHFSPSFLEYIINQTFRA